MLRLFSSLNALHQELEKLRLEVSSLKEENARLRAEVAEVSSLKEENARLLKRVEELEEKLRANSQNSSQAPSQDPFGPKKKKKKKRKISSIDFTKAPKRKNSPAEKALISVEDVDGLYECRPQSHCACGGEVLLNPETMRRYQQYELPPIEPEIYEFRLYWGHCETCGQAHEGQWPHGIPRGKLGLSALAETADLTGDYCLSKRETQRFLVERYGIEVSLRTISNAENTVSEALAASVEEATAYVREQESVNADESSHKQAGKKQWMWVAVTQWVSVFMIHANRSMKAAQALLGENFAGILTSDRYRAYNFVDVARRQLCWAHLIRDFIRISERSGADHRIGTELLALCKRMFKLWHKVRDGTMTRKRFQLAMKPIRKAMENLLEQATRDGNAKTQGTCLEILKFRQALWTFVQVEGIEPTNNAAERTIRPYVLWRKKSFGSQSERGNRFIERICTVKASCRQQSRNVREFITMALQAHFLGNQPPSLLPETEALLQQRA